MTTVAVEMSTVLVAVERVAVRPPRDHVAQVAPETVDEPALEAPSEPELEPPADPHARIAAAMSALLHRSMYDSPAQSRSALLELLVNGMVPDEARILSALSDGTEYPVIHVAERAISGSSANRVLENASSVGRAAGVARNDCTPMYVTRLLAMGLVSIGPEDTSRRDDYETLLSEAVIRSAVDAVTRGPLQAKIIRRTLRISDLGRELWEASL